MDATTPPRAPRTFGTNGINIILGIWLILAPFILGYSLQVATWNDIVVGLVVGAFALMHSYGVLRMRPSWINVVFGIWLVIAPFLLNYGDYPAPRWNDVILGLLVVIFAWSGAAVPRPPARV